ncbi:hypothetical protein SUGI_0376180 [Cryptomeria japonica]|uniref:probable xyloglucan endotransglucosylase/hydrolase protein 6 n=1 Tax=Cryptomeria japonica TaxID=3369 RepID=UPI002408945D|nr:probable xyloglucan endotransglucosylase/hydrolase protein 6 [Cryptomeria japonica]GLJ20659.1 hypothetical protein SUGI_0376180 [Cryptomeria japonica]
MDYFVRDSIFLLVLGVVLDFSVGAMPVSFSEEFEVTSREDHVRIMADNYSVQLTLDRNGDARFASKHEYMFGLVSAKIKLVAGDSAGTVTTFYLSSDRDIVRDEVDFEFLGNRSGQPYTVQTNVYAHGKGDREQRVNLWFDPSLDFHTYSIFWNHNRIIFSVDKMPIRVFKNNRVKLGVPFPNNQGMRIYSTLWNGDQWATRGGLEKIDWSKAPFHAYYKDFTIESCRVPINASCPSNPSNWWEGTIYRQLSPFQEKLYRWVRVNYMIYDYCTDRFRFPVPPPECTAGV